MSDGFDKGASPPRRIVILLKLYAYGTAMAMLGLIFDLLFVQTGLHLGPDQLAELILSSVRIGSLVLAFLFAIGLFVSLPLYKLLNLLNEVQDITSDEAQELWDRIHRFEFHSTLLSMSSWIVAAIAVGWWAVHFKVIARDQIILVVPPCIFLGMTTSIGFYLSARAVFRPVLHVLARPLPPDFSPPRMFALSRKLFMAFVFIWSAITFSLGVEALLWKNHAALETSLAVAEDRIEAMARDLKSDAVPAPEPEDHGIYLLKPFVVNLEGDVIAGSLEPQERQFVLNHHRFLGKTNWEADSPLRTFVTDILSRWIPLPEVAFFIEGKKTTDGQPAPNIQAGDETPAPSGKRWIIVRREPLRGGLHPGAVVKWKQTLSRSSPAGYLLVIFLAAALFMAGLYAAWLAGDVSEPIRNLGKVMDKVSRGGQPVPAVVESDDEIGELASSFNRMSMVLGRKMQESDEIIAAVREAGINLDGVLDRFVGVASDQAAGATEQSASLHEISATSEQIAATLRSISESAGSVNEVAGDTLNSCQKGQQKLQEVIAAMEGAITLTNDLGHKMLSFQEQADRIEGILDFIREVSERINLIALNASIEASAAGETGDRFSIIASEMRKLAEQTMSGTKEIKSLFSDLQAASSSAIIATEEGEKQVSLARRLADHASDTFQIIVHWAGETARSAQEIALSSKQQTTATAQLASALGEINELATKFADGANELESSVAELKSVGRELGSILEKGEIENFNQGRKQNDEQ